MCVQIAAEDYGVSKSTLHYRVSGKVTLNARSGRKSLLTDEEEASLIEFLVGCSVIEYAKLRSWWGIYNGSKHASWRQLTLDMSYDY